MKQTRLLWTDGSANPNPGNGGFAVIERVGGKPVPVVMGRTKYSTSIRMEGQALIEAIKFVGQDKCKIFTDSRFWIKVLKQYAPVWRMNGWRKLDQTPVSNLDIVKQLYFLYINSNVSLHWVKGHSASYFNGIADSCAKRARLGMIADNLN